MSTCRRILAEEVGIRVHHDRADELARQVEYADQNQRRRERFWDKQPRRTVVLRLLLADRRVPRDFQNAIQRGHKEDGRYQQVARAPHYAAQRRCGENSWIEHFRHGYKKGRLYGQQHVSRESKEPDQKQRLNGIERSGQAPGKVNQRQNKQNGHGTQQAERCNDLHPVLIVAGEVAKRASLYDNIEK